MNKSEKKIIAILYNTSWYIYNFRSNLIKSLIHEGYSIITIAPYDIYTEKLINIGCTHYQIKVESKNKNPFKDLLLCINLYLLLNKIRPEILLNYTTKPNIYGTIVAKVIGIPCINNIAGLGIGFVHENFTTIVLRKLYKYSQRKANMVFFQNIEDHQEFISVGAVTNENSDLLPGSGVDLNKFKFYPLKGLNSNLFIFLFVGRIMYSKGVKVLFDAAKSIYKKRKNFKIIMIGEINNPNGDGVPINIITKWKEEKYFEYHGKIENVIRMLKISHCVVLPSFYREGTPRSLLEALSVGRPIITTNMPGCKTTVINDYNGFLIKPKDVDDLVQKMEKMMDLSSHELAMFGENSRKIAEIYFDERLVINKYLKEIKLLEKK